MEDAKVLLAGGQPRAEPRRVQPQLRLFHHNFEDVGGHANVLREKAAAGQEPWREHVAAGEPVAPRH